ncbi:MAG: hypothetical protein ACLQCB_09255, partial [Spirochaetia bacterium]
LREFFDKVAFFKEESHMNQSVFDAHLHIGKWSGISIQGRLIELLKNRTIESSQSLLQLLDSKKITSAVIVPIYSVIMLEPLNVRPIDCVLEIGYGPGVVIRMLGKLATETGARLLGFEKTGRIQPGFAADIAS